MITKKCGYFPGNYKKNCVQWKNLRIEIASNSIYFQISKNSLKQNVKRLL